MQGVLQFQPMQIAEVKDFITRRAFHQVARDIYKGDPNWVPPLEIMIENAFDPSKNAFYKNGDGARWIIKDDEGRIIGRIGAFVNRNRAFTFRQPTGGCGYFECINETKASTLLFDTAKTWLAERGMEAMDGPINFGENLLNWGLLVHGYEQQGFGMPYNKPYYLDLFEGYGFHIYFKQYSYHLSHKDPFPERFWKIAEWVAKKPNLHFEHARFNNIDKYIRDFVTIYDQAWASHNNHHPADLDDVRGMVKIAKLIADEEFIWFAYNNDEPVLFFCMIPDWNQILKKLNGKINLWNIVRFIWYQKIRVMNRTRVLIMGVVPRFQGMGLESAVFWHLDNVMKRKLWYNQIELSWVGDFNPKMIAIYKAVGGVAAKTHYTMRYLFDQTIPFERAPMIVSDVRIIRKPKESDEN
jgi:hypothetical protein